MQHSMNPLLKTIVTLVGVLGIGIGCVALIHPKSEKRQRNGNDLVINDSATGDTSLETLKTLTATVSEVKEQNQKLIQDNQSLKDNNQKNIEDFKQQLVEKYDETVNLFKTKNDENQQTMRQALQSLQSKKSETDFPINNHEADVTTWVPDLVQESSNLAVSIKGNSGFSSLLNPTSNLSSHSKIKDNFLKTDDESASATPFYTIPVNATLTGALAMQPIIGRIPINGRVPDPYHFKVIIGPKNLAANGIYIPSDIKGIVASGVASGDLLGRCVRGDITSMTFVFQDGRISTTESKESEHLGEIASKDGNPCIAGRFYTNAPLFFAGTTVLAGLEGYANALSQAQTTTNSTVGIPSISTIIRNGNTYALGQAGSRAADAAEQWWQQRVQNSFDFVYVANYHAKTHAFLQLNINISQQIEIDYNHNGRKVSYEHQNDLYTVSHLD